MPVPGHLIEKMENSSFEMLHQQLEGFAAARLRSLGELLNLKIKRREEPAFLDDPAAGERAGRI
jgi:hypothetical protein